MQTRAQRKALFMIADDLLEAADNSLETLQLLIGVYRIANGMFKGQGGDPNPVTICMRVQAQALGICTLCNWLTAISEVTSITYHNRGVEIWNTMNSEMESIGIVIPFPNKL